ncbi:MAG: hypothetical protein RL735_1027 [Pseudomonadota bacterium]
MSGAANRQGKKGRDGGARILSASIIGLSTLAVVAGVAFTHMKGDPAGLSLLHENPTPPRDLAQTEAARASAEKRLAEAMAIQIANLPPVKEAEQQQVARLDPLPAQPPPMPPPTMSAPTMSAAEQDVLLSRVTGLLRQGDIGAARAILNRLVREKNAKAAYILAQSYDPQVLRQSKVVGLRGDVPMARNLYEQALRGGVTEAKAALDALAQEQ